MGRIPRDQDERFWEKVDRSGECWEWTAALSWGYGCFRTRNPRGWVKAHRYAYERLVGPIPEGLDLDHLCRNRKCVRPDHLEPVTRRENVLRGETLSGIAYRRATCIRGHSRFSITKEGWRKCLDCKNLLRRKAA